MNNTEKIKVFLVDDDALLLKSLEIEFQQDGAFDVETYPTGEQGIQNLTHNPDVIVLDYHLDSIDKTAMNGLETLDKIKKHHPDIPVIMLSSQDRIEVAINCMHHHASDYVVKSETAFMRIKKIMTDIFETKKLKQELSWYMERM